VVSNTKAFSWAYRILKRFAEEFGKDYFYNYDMSEKKKTQYDKL